MEGAKGGTESQKSSSVVIQSPGASHNHTNNMTTYREICDQEAVLSPEEYKALRKSYGLDNLVEAKFQVGEQRNINGQLLTVTKIEIEPDGGKTIYFQESTPTT